MRANLRFNFKNSLLYHLDANILGTATLQYYFWFRINNKLSSNNELKKLLTNYIGGLNET